MTFFRTKKIKGKEYAYIVENEWKRIAKSAHVEKIKGFSKFENKVVFKSLQGVKSRGSRQKVKRYLGRIYKFNIKNDADFLQFKKIESAENYVMENDFKKIIMDLIEWELFRHEIDKNKFAIDLNGMNVMQNGRNVVLLINDGFMCNLTLKNIFEFRPEGDESNDGYRLARVFVESGVKIPQDVFISLFGKLFKH